MADITNAFEVDEGISLNGDVLILTGSFDPSVGAGEAAPTGSLFLRSDVGNLFLKFGTGAADWRFLNSLPPGGLAGYVLTKNSGADFDVSFSAVQAVAAQPLDGDLTAIAALTGIGFAKRTGVDSWAIDTNTYVTSVGLSAPPEFTVSGSPVTSSGTLTFTKAVQANSTVFAGPVTGGPSQPTFRLLSLTNGDMADVLAPAPTLGQTLVWNDTAWVPIGGSGIGGSIRIWSGNIASSTGTTTIPVGVAVPTIAQGTQLASLTLTPTSASSRYSIQVSLSVSASTNNNVHSCAVFRNNVYIGGAVQTFASGGNSNAMSITLADTPNSAVPITYSFRYGTNANIWYVNRRVAENTFGGVQSGWQIQEY